MKPLPSLAAMALGGLFIAGCNPQSDQADPMTDEDQTTAPAAPADAPPPAPESTPPMDPTTQPPSDTMTPTEPPPEPAPPPNG
jgi:hypothetical protein